MNDPAEEVFLGLRARSLVYDLGEFEAAYGMADGFPARRSQIVGTPPAGREIEFASDHDRVVFLGRLLDWRCVCVIKRLTCPPEWMALMRLALNGRVRP